MHIPPIPPDILYKVFTSPDLPPTELQNFPLPVLLGAIVMSDPSEYLSSNMVTTEDIIDIQLALCPPRRVIDKLCKSLTTSTQSVLCPHAPIMVGKRFPTWIIQYWSEVQITYHAKEAFSKVLAILTARKDISAKSKSLANKVYHVLSNIPSSGPLQGFTIVVEMHYLASLVGQDWLTSEHINLLMELLRHDLIATGQGTRVKVITETSSFLAKLTQAYKNSNDYGTGKQEFCWLEQVAQSLANGTRQQLTFIANVQQNHWVACIIDAEENAIWHGNSLGGVIDSTLKLTLMWWTYFHFGKHFVVRDYPLHISVMVTHVAYVPGKHWRCSLTHKPAHSLIQTVCLMNA